MTDGAAGAVMTDGAAGAGFAGVVPTAGVFAAGLAVMDGVVAVGTSSFLPEPDDDAAEDGPATEEVEDDAGSEDLNLSRTDCAIMYKCNQYIKVR